MSPPIQLFLTTIASQPALRQRQEYLLRILQAKKIEFKSYDLASDEEAKKLWRRKAPRDKQQLPGILVGGKFPGTFTDFEEAVEYDELTQFLRLNDKWDPTLDEDRPQLTEVPIGVPGANSPSQMAKLEHKASFHTSPSPSPAPSPLRGKSGRPSLGPHLSPDDPGMQSVVEEIRKRNEEEFDVGEELNGYGLQGVKVTHDDLLKLVEDLGLDGDDAGDLVRGLSDMTGESNRKEDKPMVEDKTVEGGSQSGATFKSEPELMVGEKTKDEEEAKTEEVVEKKSEPKALGHNEVKEEVNIEVKVDNESSENDVKPSTVEKSETEMPEVKVSVAEV